MSKIKVLNLFAGIGGNRKLWPDDNIEVTAVELNPEIAAIYKDNFPNDKLIVADAHQYLLNNFYKFDFIWSSVPCPTHSRIKEMTVKIGRHKLQYPDMRLYQEIIILQEFFKGFWVVENVIPYYEPLIPGQLSGRHMFWSNFNISYLKLESNQIIERVKTKKDNFGFNISKYKLSHRKDQILRNLVNPKLGLHVWNCAFKERQVLLQEVLNE